MNERMAQTALFARLLGAGLHVPGKTVSQMLELYALELSQDRYRPAIIEAMRQTRLAQAAQQEADKKLLEKVEQLTVPETELPPLPKPKGRARRRK
jgi:hypothetical protein